MKRVLKTIISITTLLIVVSTAVYYLILAGSLEKIDGSYASYEFFPHSKTDVLEFSAGVVMSRTCCGDSEWGTYYLNDNGVWEWEYTGPVMVKGTTSVNPDADPLYFILRWDRYSLTIERKEQSSAPLRMRRRLFQSIPL